ncbi:hypothetical protein ACWDZ4_20310 [Streptomyces sp. NPDC003016]
MSTEKFSFAIDVIHASRLTAIKKKHARAMAKHAQELRGEGMSATEARLTVRRLRPELWPTLSGIVARAVEKRLAEPDLAGPWTPLDPDEEEIAALSGRGPGKNYLGHLVTRTYELPTALVKALRTASVRVSAAPLAKLDELGLTYNSLHYSEEEQRQREELIELVFSAPRIVRQALERYGPWPSEDHPPSFPPAPPSR